MSEQTTPATGPAPATARDERRASERFHPEPPSAWHALGESGGEPPRAPVRDLSATGIGLLFRGPPGPGTVLILSLQSGSRRIARPLPVRVMHVTPMADGNWLVGCEFVRRLSERELQVLRGGV